MAAANRALNKGDCTRAFYELLDTELAYGESEGQKKTKRKEDPYTDEKVHDLELRFREKCMRPESSLSFSGLGTSKSESSHPIVVEIWSESQGVWEPGWRFDTLELAVAHVKRLESGGFTARWKPAAMQNGLGTVMHNNPWLVVAQKDNYVVGTFPSKAAARKFVNESVEDGTTDVSEERILDGSTDPNLFVHGRNRVSGLGSMNRGFDVMQFIPGQSTEWKFKKSFPDEASARKYVAEDEASPYIETSRGYSRKRYILTVQPSVGERFDGLSGPFKFGDDNRLTMMTEGYIEAAEWTNAEDVSAHPRFRCRMSADDKEIAREDIQKFIATVQDLAPQCLDAMVPSEMGHNFWLTRNRHGTGFWDRDLGECGKKLTTLAHTFGEVHFTGKGCI